MRVAITGADGFIGRKLAAALAADDRVSALLLCDLSSPPVPPRFEGVEARALDITQAGAAEALAAWRPERVFHLAGVVSGEAEADFDLGMRVNLEGTRALLEALRGLDSEPRLIFTSSVAVFGGLMPDVIDDTTAPNPQNSYGTQKACCELLVNDYARRGFVDGRSLRLPTVVVRPGRPNKAASSFASSILREPLQGERAVCPVPADAPIYILSPRRVIAALIRAADLEPEAFGPNRTLNVPGLTVTVAEMVEALRRTGGEAAAARIDWEPDETVARIVRGWPTRFDAARAREMGFSADASLDEIIAAFIADDLEQNNRPS